MSNGNYEAKYRHANWQVGSESLSGHHLGIDGLPCLLEQWTLLFIPVRGRVENEQGWILELCLVLVRFIEHPT
jgi:hypothetical protein